MNQEFNKLCALILGTLYTDMTKAHHIDFMFFAAEHLGNLERHHEVDHVFGWLEREGFIRCLHKGNQKEACKQAELTNKGKTLLENEQGNHMIIALKAGAIELATSLISKILIG